MPRLSRISTIRKPRRRRSRKGWLHRLLGRKRKFTIPTTWKELGQLTLLIAIWGCVALMFIIGWYTYDLPDIRNMDSPTRRIAVTLKADDGTVFARYGDYVGDTVKLSDLPTYLPQAVLAIEDRRFYNHPGVDVIGLVRALVVNL